MIINMELLRIMIVKGEWTVKVNYHISCTTYVGMNLRYHL